MRYYFILFCFLCIFFCKDVISQKQNTQTSAIFLFGGEPLKKGYYLFKADSTFIYWGIKNEFSNKMVRTSVNIKDTLISYGKGKWSKQGKILTTRFSDDSITNLKGGSIQYSGKSSPPYDSVFIEISAKLEDGSSANYAAVKFSNSSVGTILDSNGYGIIKRLLHKINLNDDIEFTKLNFNNQKIRINNNFNYHKINIIFHKEIEQSIILNPFLRSVYKNQKNDEATFPKIYFSLCKFDSNTLKQVIKNGLVNQLQIGLVNHLIGEVE